MLKLGQSFLILMLTACGAPHPEVEKTIPPMPIEWITLSAGCYEMGEDRTYREEAPVTEQCVSDFEITAHEITVGQFAEFVEETGYVTRAERGWQADEADGPGIDFPAGSAVFSPNEGAASIVDWWKFDTTASWKQPQGGLSEDAPNPNQPVVQIALEDAEVFAAWAGGRLPSEAEWEYAARGGVQNALFSWGNEETDLSLKANTWNGIFPALNTGEDGYEGVAPVGSYPANGFGLYDMAGNVWELTASPYYPTHEMTEEAFGPEGYDPSQPQARVVAIKGGSFLCAKNYCFRYRPAARQGQDVSLSTSHIGFRIVREIAGD